MDGRADNLVGSIFSEYYIWTIILLGFASKCEKYSKLSIIIIFQSGECVSCSYYSSFAPTLSNIYQKWNIKTITFIKLVLYVLIELEQMGESKCLFETFSFLAHFYETILNIWKSFRESFCIWTDIICSIFGVHFYKKKD